MFFFSAEQAGPATVRVFLGPKYDEYDRPININANRMNFVELDKFKYDLQAGQNMITRNSQEFFYSQDYPTYSLMYNQVNSAMNGADKYNVYGSEMYYAFPSRYKAVLMTTIGNYALLFLVQIHASQGC